MILYDNDEYREKFMQLVYSLLSSDGTNDRANQIIDAFDAAPAVEAEPLPPNEPLTLDELRETDREPIYLKSLGKDFEEEGWQIVAALHKTRISRGQLYASILPLEQYGKTWLAYRRKPEEDAHGMD